MQRRKIVEEVVNLRLLIYQDRSIKIEKTFPMPGSPKDEEPETMELNSEEVKSIEKVIDFLGS